MCTAYFLTLPWGHEEGGVGNQHRRGRQRQGAEEKKVHELPLAHVRHSVGGDAGRLAGDLSPPLLPRTGERPRGLAQKRLRRSKDAIFSRGELRQAQNGSFKCSSPANRYFYKGRGWDRGVGYLRWGGGGGESSGGHGSDRMRQLLLGFPAIPPSLLFISLALFVICEEEDERDKVAWYWSMGRDWLHPATCLGGFQSFSCSHLLWKPLAHWPRSMGLEPKLSMKLGRLEPNTLHIPWAEKQVKFLFYIVEDYLIK